jgi:hypothetical protein
MLPDSAGICWGAPRPVLRTQMLKNATCLHLLESVPLHTHMLSTTPWREAPDAPIAATLPTLPATLLMLPATLPAMLPTLPATLPIA